MQASKPRGEGEEYAVIGSFTIKFEHIFLRSPENIQEHDIIIIITADDLKRVAKHVWREK